MNGLLPLGRVLFAIAVAALGVESLISSDFVPGLAPVPAGMPGRLPLAYLCGIVLVGAGLCVLTNYRARLAAFSLGSLFLLWVLLLHLARLVAAPRDANTWTTTVETLALAGAAWALAGALVAEQTSRERWNRAVGTAAKLGRFLFGLSLPVFAIQHFMYGGFVATLVPEWIPARLFWAYFVGVAFLAAGVSIVTGVKARLAGLLLGVMFASWVLIVHAPRVAAHAEARAEWTSLFIALAMCGGAWIVAGSVATGDAKRAAFPV